MSLLQTLSYQDYKSIRNLSTYQCEVIARLADLKITFDGIKNSGEVLVKYLDRKGYSVQEYKEFLITAQNTKTITTYYEPHSKVAILIANDKYEHLSKLATPSIDCESLASNLRNLGFITVIIRNSTSSTLKSNITKVIDLIPEDSYCFIFYAGHGCELCNTKCLLGIDCPTENISLSHCVTENWLLREVYKCKPELCILIMDMCRMCLDRETNPNIFSSLCCIEEYAIHSNLLVSYSTQSSKAAYEVLQIECSTTIDNDVTYELKTGDTDKIVPAASQYVNSLCSRLTDNVDVCTLLDNVHADVESCTKKQRPIKVQCGVSKRSLYDTVKESNAELLDKLRKTCEEFNDQCDIF
ncbi:uncharacterized protein LOC123711124 isoform X3 [Pieris brassicae]|uniref:Caspase family p20 domain-containing protein n=1 Tax=Pieris brassicae TaxID=7116 RepID=A0A9P0TR00_PIEBR|nr:uncharacterized protein LOC123711124 isoform X3 [Pieris brassicae]CAH4036433.1 unnamed protein product [Pieris brassicae]